MITQLIEYNDGDTVLEGYAAYEESATQKPLVLVGHDWSGRGEFACKAAERVAGLGYVGFALDMYGKGIVGGASDAKRNAALMAPFVADRAMLRRRVRAALVAGRNIPQVKAAQVAAMGYCFGGMCALELARSGADVLGVVSIHGIFTPGDVANEEIRARVLCLHGHDDPMVPPEQVLALQQELTEAGVDWQVHSYGGTMHAFTHPLANDPGFGAVYSPTAERRAYQSLENFLAEIFARGT